MNTFLQATSGFQPLRWSLAFWSFPSISAGDNPKPSSSLWNLSKEWCPVQTNNSKVIWGSLHWQKTTDTDGEHHLLRKSLKDILTSECCTSTSPHRSFLQQQRGIGSGNKLLHNQRDFSMESLEDRDQTCLGNWSFIDDWVQLRHWHMLWLRQYDANNRSDLGKPMTLSRSYSPKIKLAKIANDKLLFHSPRFSWILRR